ncbi:MAG: ABC transporter ATP-binding protein [Marmoricola sp.]
MTAALTVTDVSIAFGGTRAVDDVSFSVTDGEVLGVVGPNGAGKSTLLNCISGIYRGFTGQITLGDHQLHLLKPHQIAALGVGRTLQSVEMFREVTVSDYVLCAADGLGERPFRLGGRARRAARHDRAHALLTEVGLLDVADRSMGTLPYGRRKVADLCRALVAEPSVLLLDEPTAGTTGEDRVAMAALLRDLGRRGLQVVVVDHDVTFIRASTSTVLAMAGGRPLCQGAAHDVFADPAVQDAYLGAGAGSR